MSVRRLLLSLMLIAVSSGLCADTLPIDDFRAVDAWTSNKDGGLVAISQHTRDGRPAMRLEFACEGHKWGNAARNVSLPPNACGIEFDLYVAHAGMPADIFIWLFEKDGDGHLAQVKLDNKRLHQLSKGWHHCYVPISAFRYEPRGDKKPNLLSTDRLMIGLNGAKSEVSVADLKFTLGRIKGKMANAKTPGLKIQDGAKGRVAVLRDEFPKQPGHADPFVLAAALRSYGYGVTFVKAGDISDPSVLNWGNFDCLVLPYGSYFPESAESVVKAYLKSGGSFVSMGGYAFDIPCVADGTGKLIPAEGVTDLTAQDLSGGKPSYSINTRKGKPGDTLGLNPDQIGVFDPTYHLNNAMSVRPAGMQYIIPMDDVVRTKVEGYAACSMLGSNNPVFPNKWGRHIPLMNGVDKYGRSVGPAGAIAHNYDGPYAGSSWAFFGVTNTDLFAKTSPILRDLGPIVDAVTRKAYLHSLATDLTCYKDGDWVVISVKMANSGRKAFTGNVSFSIYDRSGKNVINIPPITGFVKPGTTADLQTEWRPLEFDSDLYRIVSKLQIDGKTVDTIETGFVAEDPKTIAGGLKLNYKDNYFRDGDRPLLLSGTNVTGAIFCSGNENPLVWDRDLARMRENGVNILRVLHFSPFVSQTPSASSAKPLDLAVDELPIATERKLDALIQLCQKHKVALFLTLHDWMGVDLTDEELAAQRKFAKLIAARYKDVPGFMIDIQNEPKSPSTSDAPHVVKLWNDWLKDKYETDEALKAAWRVSPPEKPLGEIAYKPGTDAWDDMRTFDADMFRNVLVNRWIKANRDGVREGDPDVPVTVGFLQAYFALNKLLCVDDLDFACMHSYTDIETLRAELKILDRRFEGKSFSLGEFGSVKDHQARVDGADSKTQDYMRFLQTGHYLFGEGGSFMANWCWKDMGDVIFPWGVNYQNSGPRKDIMKAWRNQTLLFRQIRPTYKSPSTFLVIPTSMMLGGKSGESINVFYRIVDQMLGDADFGTIDDQHLDRLPPSADTLVYPLPFSIPDKAYEQLKAWVRKGGRLVITGDIGFDGNRKRTHTDRLEELCGVRFAVDGRSHTNWTTEPSPYVKVEPTSASSVLPSIYTNCVGGGMVDWCPDPIGRTADGGSIFDTLPERDPGPAHVFLLEECDGCSTWVAANPSGTTQAAGIGGGYELTIKTGGTGMARWDGADNVVSIETQGPITIGKRTIPMTGHWALISCDGKDITQSREMIVLPFGEGEIDLGGRSEHRTSNVQRSTSKGPAASTINHQPSAIPLVVQTGDIINGKWQVLSESTNLKIKATAADAFDIRIVAPRNRLKALAEYVVAELMLSSGS